MIVQHSPRFRKLVRVAIKSKQNFLVLSSIGKPNRKLHADPRLFKEREYNNISCRVNKPRMFRKRFGSTCS